MTVPVADEVLRLAEAWVEGALIAAHAYPNMVVPRRMLPEYKTFRTALTAALAAPHGAGELRPAIERVTEWLRFMAGSYGGGGHFDPVLRDRYRSLADDIETASTDANKLRPAPAADAVEIAQKIVRDFSHEHANMTRLTTADWSHLRESITAALSALGPMRSAPTADAVDTLSAAAALEAFNQYPGSALEKMQAAIVMAATWRDPVALASLPDTHSLEQPDPRAIVPTFNTNTTVPADAVERAIEAAEAEYTKAGISMMSEAREAIRAALSTDSAKDGWRSIETYSEDMGLVLVSTIFRSDRSRWTYIAAREDGLWSDSMPPHRTVTHWQPLPAAPQADDGGKK